MTPLGIHLDRAPGLADTLRDAFVMDLSTDRERKDTFLARLGTTDLKYNQRCTVHVKLTLPAHPSRELIPLY